MIQPILRKQLIKTMIINGAQKEPVKIEELDCVNLIKSLIRLSLIRLSLIQL